MVRERSRLSRQMPENRGKYSIEELLRAKRDERPDEAFWSRFDRELKDKQRRLLQRQIGERVDLRSPFAKRIYKFTAVGSSLGFAAIAVTIGFRTLSNEHAPSLADLPETEMAAQPKEVASSAPVFTVSQPVVKRVEPTAPALQEFSTLAQAPRPRIVVEVLNPDISDSKAKNLAAAEPARRPATRPAANAVRMGEFSAEFTSSLGLFQDAPAIEDELNEPLSQRLSNLEQSYYLGKYADPLGGDFTAAYDTARSAVKVSRPGEARSFSDLDERLSSQGNRSSKSLDSLTLRF